MIKLLHRLLKEEKLKLVEPSNLLTDSYIDKSRSNLLVIALEGKPYKLNVPLFNIQVPGMALWSNAGLPISFFDVLRGSQQ